MSSEVQLIQAVSLLGANITAEDLREFLDSVPDSYKQDGAD